MVNINQLKNMMDILNLVSFRDPFHLIQMVKQLIGIKILGSINVAKTTEVISMINQIKKKTISTNMINNMNNLYALTILQT